LKATVLFCLLSISTAAIGAGSNPQIIEDVSIGDVGIRLFNETTPRYVSKDAKPEPRDPKKFIPMIALFWESKDVYESGSGRVKDPDKNTDRIAQMMAPRFASIDGIREAEFNYECHVNKGNKWWAAMDAEEWGYKFVTNLARGSSLEVCGFTFDLTGAREAIENTQYISEYLVK
jgi:hypothetical protein